MALLGNTIYTISGMSNLHRYDPATNTWTARSSVPTADARGSPAVGVAVALNGRLYAVGGSYYYGDSFPRSAVYEYTPVTDTWVARADMPTARWGLAVAAGANGRLYAMGGMTRPSGPSLAVVEEYDPIADTWSARASMPLARTGLGAATAQSGLVYAVGGQDFGAPVSASVQEYDPQTNTWTVRTSMPTPRWGLAVALRSTSAILAIGGTDGTTTYATVEEYAPSANTWTASSSLLTGRYNLGAATTSDGRTYAVGGMDTGSGPLVTAVEEGAIVSPTPSYWVDVPSVRRNADIGW